MADHAPPFQVLAGVEARRVDECEQADVERVAERHEPRRLLRRRDVERSCERDRLVGDDADRPPAHRGERGDDVGGPAVTDLEEAPVVDQRRRHLADVVAPRRRRWDQLARLRTQPVDRVVARPSDRLLVSARRKVGEQVEHGIRRCLAVGDHEARHPGVAGEVRGPAELARRDLDPGELRHHHRAVDERVARLRHHDEVGDAEQQRRTGHGRAVDHDDRRHDPRTVDQRLGEAPPPFQGGNAFHDVGPRRREHDDQGHALDAGDDGGVLDRVGRGGRQRDAPESGLGLPADFDPDDPAGGSVDLIDGANGRWTPASRRRCEVRGWRSTSRPTLTRRASGPGRRRLTSRSGNRAPARAATIA